MTFVTMQISHLLKLILYMKRWKFLWSIAVFISLISNHFVFPIVDNWMGTKGQTYVDMGAEEFAVNNIILAEAGKNKQQLSELKSMLKTEGVDTESMVENCAGPEACEANMFNFMYGRINTSRFSNYIYYLPNGSTQPNLLCHMAFGGELNCPYLGNLAAISQHKDGNSLYGLKKIRFFSLVSHKEGKKVDSERGKDTMCANHQNFEAVYSRAIMMQCMLIVGTMSFYFLVSTQSCIAELKSGGFLQLMFQRGLSVPAYWIVIGCLTAGEVLVFSVIFVISLAVQCLNFFSPAHMLAVFAMTVSHLLSLACVAVLFTVTLGSYFYVGLLTVLTAILTMVLILINRMLLSTMVWLKLIILFLFPLGHFGEFVQGAMLAEIRMQSLDLYNSTILFVNILLPIVLIGIIIYLDYTLAAGNGLRLPRNFIMQSQFWKSRQSGELEDGDSDPLVGEEPEPRANVEPVTDELQPLVRLSKLSKTFKPSGMTSKSSGGVQAIKDMSALIYENHITAIIGHNGAGKTTLLNLLTGAEVPTTGQVSICGILASSPMQRLRLRGKLGICPQSVSFAANLTVEQTLKLAIVSCGLYWEECDEEVAKVMKAASLDNKRNLILGRMSTGQQRKLAVSLALLGNPKVLFLDEPTSGVDPESRRRMWKLLREYRPGRAIVLSTQFMDEADTLADRKIFLSGGSFICAGSSLFLKSAFDCGFVFEVTLKSPKHSSLLRRRICEDFPSVKAKNSFGNNINFHLPARDIDKLPTLAQALEKRMELISAFGLLQASLYDIFMKLKDLDQKAVEELFSEDQAGLPTLDEDTSDVVESEVDSSRMSRLSGVICQRESKLRPSLLQQLSAMIIVNVMRTLRTRVKLVCRFVVPVFLLLILLATALVERSNANHRLHLRVNMTNSGRSFTRGVCVYEEVPGVPRIKWFIDYSFCGLLFTGSMSGPYVSPTRFLVLKKERRDISLADFLQLAENVKQITKTCNSKSKEAGPCPIVYTSNWGDSLPNSNRTLYVGSYSLYEHFNASTSALVSMGVFQKAAAHFTIATRSKTKLDEDGFFFTAESVYDYRSTFVPTMGAFFQLLILTFIPATFLDDIIEDKETRVRSQLASMGMGCIGYWMTNFIIHWLQYSAAYSLSVFLLLVIVQTGYSSMYFTMGIFLPTLFLGLPSNQLLVYVLSTVLGRSNHLVTILYFFFSILLGIGILIVQLNNTASIILIALLPPYATIALTFYGVKTIFYTLSFYETDSLSNISSLSDNFYFTQPHVIAAFAACFVHTCLLLCLLALAENQQMLRQMLETYFGTGVSSGREEAGEDPGVIEETERVNSNPRSAENILEVRHLCKTFPNGTKVVRDVTFATGPAEIFGLLGPNGAGKTTTLSMIVGQLKATSGRCEIVHKQRWLPSGIAATKGAIGYCPQFDPLYSCITATEHMQFYASILGVSKESMEENISGLTDGLGLDTAVGKQAGQLSVGNRRRLSMAISLLGEPTVLVIDEATTGVDPEGKRFLWQVIRSTATFSCTVIVTTHSMEEVEAICNRVSVLNRGLMVGLGTVQQLRSRYGSSYSLEILIRTAIDEDPAEVQAKKATLIENVFKKFANCSILEEFNDRVHFSFPVASVGRLSNALSWLIERKTSLHIHYFSFHQMSMDQVFEQMVKTHEKLMTSQKRPSMFCDESTEEETEVRVKK